MISAGRVAGEIGDAYMYSFADSINFDEIICHYPAISAVLPGIKQPGNSTVEFLRVDFIVSNLLFGERICIPTAALPGIGVPV